MITTAETYHVPVLLKESVDGLDIQPDGIYVDVTFGGGGHSKEILSRLGKNGHLYSFDQDADAEKNIVDDDRFTFVRSNFRYISQWMRYYGVEQIDGLLGDLGVSSHHFDDETRGFSFRFDAPLDMRMNKRAGQTAADILNNYSEEQLADVFYLYGELKNARRIAKAIVGYRNRQCIETTSEFLTALGVDVQQENSQLSILNSQLKKDMARLYQALRIEVNHEMDALRDMLKGATDLLREGGRLSIITYHSLEDRIVKNVMKAGNAEGKVEQDFFGRILSPYRLVNKVTTPTEEEQQRNPRSRSAKLRIAEKV
jgi:16S rRNA (cytosine1402-N4)-methyltransferase